MGAGNQKRARQSMLTGIGVGLVFGCAVFALVMLKGDVLAGDVYKRQDWALSIQKKS